MPAARRPRFVLFSAALAVAALALVGCSPAEVKAPVAASPKPSSWQEHNDAQADARDAKVDFDEGDSECPDGILRDVGDFDGGGHFEIIGAAEFMAKSVGAEILNGGCLVRSTVTVDAMRSVYESAYVEGDKETVEQIFASLTGDGFKAEGGDLFVNNEKVYVSAWTADDEASAKELATLDLGFEPVVMIVAWQDIPVE